MNTRFYKLSMNDFRLFFKNAYMIVDDTKELFLEHVYYNILINEHLKFRRFNRSLEFRGKSGTNGAEYCAIYNKNMFAELVYNSFLYRTYFGREILKYIRRIVVKE